MTRQFSLCEGDLPRFSVKSFGVVVQTPGAAKLPAAFRVTSFAKHLHNDWGDLDEHDIKANIRSLTKANGDRIMSVYKENGETLWIITSGFGNDPSDPDACNTVLMLPEEY